MLRSLLVRGLLVGAFAGLLAFAFAVVFGEPQVQHAIDFEDFLAKQAHEPAEAELVTRGVQRTWGLLTGTVLVAIGLGGAFSLVFAWAYGRVGIAGARTLAAVLALGAFLAITLVPFTKYPANPPTVGDPATLNTRTLLFFAMIAITVLTFVAALRIRAQLLERMGAWNASLLAVLAFVVVIAVAELILPGVHETPKGFPADVLYRFRLSSLGINLTMWTAIGLTFGAVAERLLVARAPKPVPVAAEPA
jgi:hypothetical protein